MIQELNELKEHFKNQTFEDYALASGIAVLRKGKYCVLRDKLDEYNTERGLYKRFGDLRYSKEQIDKKRNENQDR